MKKNIIVTGAETETGRATAQLLSKEGHHVFATMAAAEETNRISAQYLTDWAFTRQLFIEVVNLDVSDEVSVSDAIWEIGRKTDGQIDVVILNYNIQYFGLNETLSTAIVSDIFQANVIGVDRIMKAVLPYMHRQRDGLIITLSSVWARQPLPMMGIYSASKAAVDALAVSYHYELKSTGVDVVIVQAGLIPVPGSQESLSKTQSPDTIYNYGPDMKHWKQELNEKLLLASPKTNNDEVAKAIKDLIDSPKGLRSLWTVIESAGRESSVRYINQATRELVDTTLMLSGVSEDYVYPEIKLQQTFRNGTSYLNASEQNNY